MPDWAKKLLADVPVLGALAKGADGGVTTSEFGFCGAALAAVLALPDCPGWARAVACAVIAGAYCFSRANAKREA